LFWTALKYNEMCILETKHADLETAGIYLPLMLTLNVQTANCDRAHVFLHMISLMLYVVE